VKTQKFKQFEAEYLEKNAPVEALLQIESLQMQLEEMKNATKLNPTQDLTSQLKYLA
jgi:hypothetical protein